VFLSSRRLAGRFGLRRLFVVGAAVAAVIMGLIAVAPEPWMVNGLRTLDGVSYALRYMAMVLIVGALLPRSLHAFGQSLAWFVYAGIAPIIADAAGGLVYATLGAQALFLATMADGAIIEFEPATEPFGSLDAEESRLRGRGRGTVADGRRCGWCRPAARGRG